MRLKLPTQAASILPLVLLLVAVATGGFLSGMLASSKTASPQIIRTAADANAVRASSLWMIGYIVLIVTLAWTAFVSIAIIAAHLKAVGLWITGVATGLAMLVGHASSIESAARPGSVMTTIDRATQLPIHSTAVVSSTLALGVVTLVVAAAVALGRRPNGILSESQLRSRLGEARLFLFSAAATLASALVSIYFTMVWPIDLPTVSSSPIPNGVLKELAITVTLASGIFYSAMLVVLFVPSAIIHERWIEESWNAARDHVPNQSRANWLSENGLDRSLADTGVQIVAIAAPWLAAIGLPQL
ncbi:MAG: hypothetical protein AABO58_16265 [Acidobacteriota bacterium]